ncbi:MAG: hypothetical protein AB7K52_02795 [Phycisphaerales bacterium]
MWSVDLVVSEMARALQEEEARLVAEQGHQGIDALEEVAVQGVLAERMGSEARGWGVLREQRYPAEWRRRGGRRGELPGEADRLRCDLVLTPAVGQRLADELRAERAARARRSAATGTLFEEAEEREPRERDEGIGAAEAYWIEVKVVGQFCCVGGVPAANGSYASQIIRGVGSDIRKLRDDRGIERAAAALVLFTVDEEVARNDLLVLAHRCLDAELPIRTPVQAGFGIADRMGNSRCTVWAAELSKTGG